MAKTLIEKSIDLFGKHSLPQQLEAYDLLGKHLHNEIQSHREKLNKENEDLKGIQDKINGK